MVYMHSQEYAYTHDEVMCYNISKFENNACKQALEHALANKAALFKMRKVYRALCHEYGTERVKCLLANTVCHKKHVWLPKKWAVNIQLPYVQQDMPEVEASDLMLNIIINIASASSERSNQI